jgi:hypothetical protein
MDVGWDPVPGREEIAAALIKSRQLACRGRTSALLSPASDTMTSLPLAQCGGRQSHMSFAGSPQPSPLELKLSGRLDMKPMSYIEEWSPTWRGSTC